MTQSSMYAHLTIGFQSLVETYGMYTYLLKAWSVMFLSYDQRQ